MEAAIKTFFATPRFAVVGASSDPAKFGHKGKSPLPASGGHDWRDSPASGSLTAR
jgi:hypothetical protein